MGWLEKLNPLGFITDIVKAPLEEWQKRKTIKVENEEKRLQREHEIRLKKIDVNLELAKQGMQIEADWDRAAQEDMKHTWKDEYFAILFSIPLIASFVPQLQEHMLRGFEILDKTPDWYKWLIIGIVVATFGLRWMFNKIKLR